MKLIKDYFQKFFKNQLIAGSFVLFAGTSIANFGNYLFHLLMGRMLGPADYGVLASLISLTYLFGIPIGALSWTTIKYVSALRGKKQFGAIAFFYSWLNKKLVIFGLVGFLLLLIVSPWISSFLHLESIWSLLLIITASLVSIYLIVNTAVLQGYLRFGLISVSATIQAALKVIIGPVLVLLGLRVLGASLVILISLTAGYLFTAFFVFRMLKNKKKRRDQINTQEIFEYMVPVFFWTLAFISLYTTDIVLARHFLPPQEAGFYAALATLGKIIFFASSPIIMVMFPMVSERHANGKKYGNLLILSLGLVFLVCLGISGIYFLLPKLMVDLLYGSQYLAAAPHLWLFAIFLSLYSLSYLVTSFYLSIKKVKVVILPIAAALLQIVLIFLFHQNLRQTVLMSITATALLLGILLLYYFQDETKKNKEKTTLSYRSRL